MLCTNISLKGPLIDKMLHKFFIQEILFFDKTWFTVEFINKHMGNHTIKFFCFLLKKSFDLISLIALFKCLVVVSTEDNILI